MSGDTPVNALLVIDHPGRDDDPHNAIRLEILDGPNPDRDADGWEHYAYKVRLHFDGRTLDSPWRQGTGITEDPSAEEVLDSMLMDAGGFDNSDGFEEWAGEYGYDTDSRKAESTYRITGDQTRRLADLLGPLYDRAVFPTDHADSEEVARRLVRSGRVV